MCEERDPKGHYQKARKGVIKDFTGISAPYEAPIDCDLVLKTDRISVDDCADQVIRLLIMRDVVRCEEQ